MRTRVLLGLAGLILALGAAAWWGQPEPQIASAPLAPLAEPTGRRPEEVSPALPAAAVPAPPLPTPSAEPPVVSLAPVLAVAPGMLPWEEQIATILSRSSGIHAAAAALLASLPALPEEAYATVAQEAAARVTPADFTELLQPLLLRAETHGAVQSVLFADLSQRPDRLALPVLLAVARQPEHPFASAAKENLGLRLGADHGTDWTAWQQAVKERLAR